MVRGFLQGQGAHHRLTEKLGSADLLLPVLLQGRRWLLRLPESEPCATDHKQDEQMKGMTMESTKVINLTEEVCDPRDLRLVPQL